MSCRICSEKPLVDIIGSGRTRTLFSTPCNHLFHGVCLRNWFRNSINGSWCPHCKTQMKWRDAIPFEKQVKTLIQPSWENSVPKSDFPVQSLTAEIKQRKAEEAIRKKSETDKSRADELQKRRVEKGEKRQLISKGFHRGNTFHAKNFMLCALVIIWAVMHLQFHSTEISFTSTAQKQEFDEDFQEMFKVFNHRLDCLARLINDNQIRFTGKNIETMINEMLYNIEKAQWSYLKEIMGTFQEIRVYEEISGRPHGNMDKAMERVMVAVNAAEANGISYQFYIRNRDLLMQTAISKLQPEN